MIKIIYMLWTWIVVALDTKMARLQDSVMLAKLSLEFFWAPYQIRRSRRYDELEESLIAGLLLCVSLGLLRARSFFLSPMHQS